MPDPSLITGTAAAHLEMLPPVLRDDPSYQAVIYALAKEIDRLESFIEQVRAQFNPNTADVMLKAWEVMTGVTVEPSGQTVAERRSTVVAMLRKRVASPTGLSWEDNVTALVGPGWSYQEHVEGDGTTPPAGTIRVILPFPPTSDRYALTERMLRQITRAGKDLQLQYSGGFVLDESQLDQEGLG